MLDLFYNVFEYLQKGKQNFPDINICRIRLKVDLCCFSIKQPTNRLFCMLPTLHVKVSSGVLEEWMMDRYNVIR